MKVDTNAKSNNEDFEKDIDLKTMFGIFLRNKYLISSFSIFFFIVSCLYAISKKTIWEGDFQIVLNNNSNNNNLINNSISLSRISGLIGADFNSNTSLTTEVGILKSTSILMPVYEYVKNEKQKKYPKKEFESFRGWNKDFLNMNLKKRTSILEISYRDYDKELIIPALNKIAKAYQKYSGKSKKRNIELTTIYLENQIKEYKNKVDRSLRLAQDYAIDQDLSIFDTGNDILKNIGSSSSYTTGNDVLRNIGSSSSYTTGKSVNVEVARLRAANQIKQIEITLNKIQNFSEKSDDDVAFISIVVPELVSDGTFDALIKENLKISDLKTRFKDNYIPLLKAEQKRSIMIEKIKSRAISLLKAKKIIAEATYQTALRPKDVLLKYKQLVREAERDESTLIELEDNLRIIKLEEARIEDPWELITKPRLKLRPIAPSRKNIALLGGFFGLVTGFIASIYREHNSGFVFSKENLELLLQSNILMKFKKSNQSLSDFKSFITEMIALSNNKDLKILVSKTFYNSESIYINELSSKENLDMIFINQISGLEKSNLILFTSIGNITKNEINEINQRLQIIDKKLLGIVLI